MKRIDCTCKDGKANLIGTYGRFIIYWCKKCAKQINLPQRMKIHEIDCDYKELETFR